MRTFSEEMGLKNINDDVVVNRQGDMFFLLTFHDAVSMTGTEIVCLYGDGSTGVMDNVNDMSPDEQYAVYVGNVRIMGTKLLETAFKWEDDD